MSRRRLTLPLNEAKVYHRKACEHPYSMNAYRALWGSVHRCKNVAKQAYITAQGDLIVYMVDKDMSVPSEVQKGFAYIIGDGGAITIRKFDVDNITQLRTCVRDLAQA